jgi:hypothetical protein
MFNAINAIYVQLFHMKHLIEDMGILVPCGEDSQNMVGYKYLEHIETQQDPTCMVMYLTFIGKEWK